MTVFNGIENFPILEIPANNKFNKICTKKVIILIKEECSEIIALYM